MTSSLPSGKVVCSPRGEGELPCLTGPRSTGLLDRPEQEIVESRGDEQRKVEAMLQAAFGRGRLITGFDKPSSSYLLRSGQGQ